MALPFTYNVRNVFVRWRATLATVLGVALVVAVYILLQALAAGLETSSRNTGDPRNLMIVRKGSTAESSSQVTREQIKIFQYYPQIAQTDNGQPLVSADLVVLVSLPRAADEAEFSSFTTRILSLFRGPSQERQKPAPAGEANVTLRGITPIGMELRPQVSLVEGRDARGTNLPSRWFVPGKREVVVSYKMAGRFANCAIGQTFRTGGAELTVVGWMDGGDSAFDSEIWMDADEARSLFDRENYSSVLARMKSPAAADEFMRRVESDKRLPLRVDYEVKYYSEQTQTALPIKILGNLLATAMSIGAVFAAMNTMYASVGARTREIGTLRVLGYRRRTILASFIIEGAILAALGGLLGCAGSYLLQSIATAVGWQFGTLNFNTFSEVVFQFRITPALAVKGMIFSIVVGIVGSLLPAIRASRLPVIAALKAV